MLPDVRDLSVTHANHRKNRRPQQVRATAGSACETGGHARSSSAPAGRASPWSRWSRPSRRRSPPGSSADLGARVIKVERPGTGDFARDYDRAVHGQSSYFVWLNRGKESLALDLKSRPTGRSSRPAGPRRRVRAEPYARRRRAARVRRRRAARTAPAADHLLGLRLRPRRTVPRQKAYDLLVQARPACWRSPAPPGAGQGGHLGGRHRGRDVRVHRHPDRAVRAGAHRPRQRLRRFACWTRSASG